MKIKGNEILWLSDKGNAAVTYGQFDLGAKYKVLRRVRYGENIVWDYVNSFTDYCEALNYAKKIYDCIIER